MFKLIINNINSSSHIFLIRLRWTINSITIWQVVELFLLKLSISSSNSS